MCQLVHSITPEISTSQMLDRGHLPPGEKEGICYIRNGLYNDKSCWDRGSGNVWKPRNKQSLRNSAVPQESENSGLFLTSLQTALCLPVPLLHVGKAIWNTASFFKLSEVYLKACLWNYREFKTKVTGQVNLKFTWDKEIWLEERGLPWHSRITEQFQMPLSRLPGGCVFWSFLISPFTQDSNRRYWSY